MATANVSEIIEAVKKEMQLEALWAGILEVLRLGVISAGAWIATEGIGIVVEAVTKTVMDPTVKVLLVGLIIAFGKGLDRGVHKYGTLTKNDSLTQGITRF